VRVCPDCQEEAVHGEPYVQDVHVVRVHAQDMLLWRRPVHLWGRQGRHVSWKDMRWFGWGRESVNGDACSNGPRCCRGNWGRDHGSCCSRCNTRRYGPRCSTRRYGHCHWHASPRRRGRCTNCASSRCWSGCRRRRPRSSPRRCRTCCRRACWRDARCRRSCGGWQRGGRGSSAMRADVLCRDSRPGGFFNRRHADSLRGCWSCPLPGWLRTRCCRCCCQAADGCVGGHAAARAESCRWGVFRPRR